MVIASAPQNKEFELAPEGNHLANCYRLVDLGHQVSTWNGQPSKPKHKIMVSWELPDELMESGQPFTISQRYTVSLHENAQMRKDLESWRGRSFTEAELAGFDLSNILGKPCMLNIAHTQEGDKTYANVVTVAPLPKGFPPKPLVNEIVNFDLSAFDEKVFEAFSEGVKKTIAKSPEYQKIITSDIPL